MKKNPYREVLTLLQASGATRLVSGYVWSLQRETPCGCVFGTVTRFVGVASDFGGHFRAYPPSDFLDWAKEHGLTKEIVEELETFNDTYASEAIEHDLDVRSIDPDFEPDRAFDVDFDRYAEERYTAVVEYLKKRAAEFEVTP